MFIVSMYVSCEKLLVTQYHTQPHETVSYHVEFHHLVRHTWRQHSHGMWHI
jgi:hypothetical protein